MAGMSSKRELRQQLAHALALGSESYETGQYEEAVRAYTHALYLCKEHHLPIDNEGLLTLHTNRGISLSSMRRYQQALEDFTQAIELLPDWDELHYNRGACHIELGEYDKAIVDFSQSLRLKPEDARAYNNRGVAYLHSGRCTEAIGDFKRTLELDPEHENAQRNQKMRSAEPNDQVALLQLLATALSLLPNRGNVQAACLLESYLELKPDDYDNIYRMSEALAQSKLDALDANNQATVLRVLADALLALPGRGASHAAHLMESYLLLGFTHYADEGRMRAALRQSKMAALHSNSQATVLAVLAKAWCALPRRGCAQAALLLESYLGLSYADYADGTRMRAVLEGSPLLAELEPNSRVRILKELARALSAVPGRGDIQAALLLESYLGLSYADYADGTRMRAALEGSPQLVELEPNSRVTLLAALAEVVGRAPGRGKEQAAILLESYVGKAMFLFASADSMKDVARVNVLAYLRAWLQATHGATETTLATCHAVVTFVKNVREEELPTYAHRVEFLSNARTLWGELQRVALERIEHDPPFGGAGQRRGERRLRQLLGWAEQFHNRLLVERMRVDQRTVGSDGDTKLSAWVPWQLALIRGVGDENVTRHQSPAATQRYSAAVVPSCLTDQPTQVVEISAEESAAVWATARQLERRMQPPEGREPELHELLPAGSVWVRAIFDHEGRLRWWAWQCQDEQLVLLAEGTSSPNAERELKTANFRFDLEVERLWLAYEGRTVDDMEDEALLDRLVTVARNDNQWRELLQNPNRGLALRGEVYRALQRLKPFAPLLTGLGEALADAILDSEQTIDPWMIHDFRAGLAMLRRPWGPMDLSQGEATASRDLRRREALDKVSQQHLEAVKRHFDIRELWPVLDPNQWANTDVLFQTPGPLWAAPLSWLPFNPVVEGGAAPLFHSVASTGSVISLTLRQLAEQQAAGQIHRRVLTVHWDEPERRGRADGMFRLQSEIVDICRKREWEVWCLGDQPKATVANVRAALNDPHRRFGVLVVNAHGIRERFGVKLSEDTEWNGTGADLRDTDLIVLAACSVGRLREDGYGDVEGLCAELAAHHGRTVVAARWPVADTETAALASELVRDYVNEIGAVCAGSFPPPFVRARAFNRARRRLLNTGVISFHVAAAFEIYGLG